MKRFISLVCGSLVLILLFLSPGNAVQAEEQDECDCPGTVFTGSERNKLVANLLKSNVFKEERLELKKDGYVWQGAGAIEVRELAPGMIVYQVVFLSENGEEVGAAFGLISGSIQNLDYLAPIHDHDHNH
ncbi:hypothetical protein [Mesobacillus maritimus]|uniref:Uncharacterized protein n=1 Tax=Mesobacillus maritimus TaxID=1643336 RepID=A0ABS7K4T9_9BACI|nr:hypothetical protein [Mesobacillus maritimus]MBY0097156.1 hypothetical protein [Mesobacillus maritimus]